MVRALCRLSKLTCSYEAKLPLNTKAMTSA